MSGIARDMLQQATKEHTSKYNDMLDSLQIVATSNIDEETMQSLDAQGQFIDVFGITTSLVTCKRQRALGCLCEFVN